MFNGNWHTHTSVVDNHSLTLLIGTKEDASVIFFYLYISSHSHSPKILFSKIKDTIKDSVLVNLL
jgi:hypothetical protein